TKFRVESGKTARSRTILSKTNLSYTGSANRPKGWVVRTDSTSGYLMIEGSLVEGTSPFTRMGSTLISSNGTYWLRVVSVGGIVKLLLSTDGINFTEETLSGTNGTNEEIRALFNNDLNDDTLIGITYSGSAGYRFGMDGDIYFLKVWKG